MIISCNNQKEELISPNGYKYKFITQNEDGKIVQVGDIVSLSISILAQDGEVKEQMNGENMAILQAPAEGSKEAKISPIHELLIYTKVGDSLMIYVPLDSLPQVPPGMEEFEYLTYNFKVEKAISEVEYQAEQEALRLEGEKIAEEIANQINATIDSYHANSLDLESTESGLKYIVHEKGTGRKIESGDLVKVQYYGSLLNKESFDNSFVRGQPFQFPVGQGRVIQGWDEGLQLLNVGDKATFFIPYALGYGEAGAGDKIPGKSDLVFYVEVISAS